MAVVGTIVTAFKVAAIAAVRAAIRAVTAGLAKIGAAGVRSMAALGSKIVGVASALKALGTVGAFAAIKNSIDSTVDSVKSLKQLTSLLRLPPEFVSEYQSLGAEVGIERDDLNGIFSGFASAASEAAADTESEFAKTFRALGVQVTDAKGRMRDLSSIFVDLAVNSQKVDAATKGFKLNQIFGDDDALKVSPLLDKLAKMGVAGANARYASDRDAGLLVTKAQLDAIAEYTSGLGKLKNTLDIIKRLITVEIAPTLGRIFQGFSKILLDNRKEIVAFFKDFFDRAVRFVADVAVVFGGLDVQELFGQSNTVQNGWLYTAKEGLLQLLAIAQLLGKGFVAIGRAADSVFNRIFGFSLEDWAKRQTVDSLTVLFKDALDYVRRLVLDIGSIFTGNFDGGFETGIGEFLGKAVGAVADFGAKVRAEIGAVVTYIRTAFGEVSATLDFGASSASATTGLGYVLASVVEVTRAVKELFAQFEKVFLLGEQADTGYKWIEDVNVVLTSLLGTLKTFVEIMQLALAPIQAIIGLFGDWSAAGVLLAGTVLVELVNVLTGGLLAAGVTAGFAALSTAIAGLGLSFTALLGPIGLAVAAIGGLIALYGTLKGMSDAARDAGLDRARQMNDASFDRYGAKPGSGYRAPANVNVPSPPAQVKAGDDYVTKVAIELPGIPRDVLVSMSRSELDYLLAFNGRKVS